MIRSNFNYSKLLTHSILVSCNDREENPSQEKPVEYSQIPFSLNPQEILHIFAIFSLLLCGVISISKVKSIVPEEESKHDSTEKEIEDKLIQSTENLNNLINDNTKNNLLKDLTFYEKIHNHITYAMEYEEIVKKKKEEHVEVPNHQKIIEDAAMVIYHIGLRDDRFENLKSSFNRSNNQ